MGKISGQFSDAAQIEQLELTVTVVLPLAHWKRIAQALAESKEGHYGPVAELHRAIGAVITNVGKRIADDVIETKD